MLKKVMTRLGRPLIGWSVLAGVISFLLGLFFGPALQVGFILAAVVIGAGIVIVTDEGDHGHE